MRSLLRGQALVLFLAASLLGACNRAPPEPGAERAQPGKPPAASYSGELKKLDAAIGHGIELAGRQPDNSLIPVEVVGLYLERARLTGSYADFSRAEELLAALEKSGRSQPSCLVSARLHFTLHRLSAASHVLQGCPATIEPSEIAALQADISLYLGQYRKAESVYRALVNDVGLSSHYVRLAQLKKWLGAPGEAAALLEAAEKRYHGNAPTMLAWLKLQRGLIAMDRGRLDEALALFRLASDAMPGWWLVEEHIAEVQLLMGNAAESKRLYEEIVARTDAPEFLGALAEIELQQGNSARARQLIDRAGAIHEKRMADFPDAAAGHMVDHFQRHSPDAGRLLQIARKNFAARPYGEPAIALAKANLFAAQPKQAVALINAQLAKGWDTAEAYWVLSRALQRLDSGLEAQTAQAEALRRNPRAASMYAFRETPKRD